MSDQFFSYQLNYSMANEDSWLERAIVAQTSRKRILSVCGSGSRSLCLLQDGVETLDIIDLSQIQLLWGKLRLKTLQELDFPHFQRFWGYRTCKNQERGRDYCSLLNEELTPLEKIFDDHNWSPPLYYGKWEKTFFSLSQIVQKVLGQKRIQRIFLASTLEEQVAIYQQFSFRARWKLILLLLGNRALFNALLYKGDFVKKNISQTHYHYYLEAFDRIFKNEFVRKNFFAQLSFYGRIQYPEGSFLETDPEIWQSMKRHFSKSSIRFYQNDILTHCRENTAKYDFVSLSDIPSYFTAEQGKDFLQIIRSSLAPGAIVVVRYYLRVCWPNEQGFEDVSEQFRQLIERECVQMYKIKVYRFCSDIAPLL